MKFINFITFIIILNVSCFAFSDNDFDASRKQFDKEFKASQDKFDAERKKFDEDFKASQENFDAERKKFDEDFKTKQNEFQFQSNLTVGLIGLLFLIIGFFGIKRYRKYKKFPLLRQYIEENPNCKTDNGIKCKYCGSKSIRNFGLYKANSEARLHICNSCGESLYRSTFEI